VILVFNITKTEYAAKAWEFRLVSWSGSSRILWKIREFLAVVMEKLRRLIS
jgi:hypothetical protein